MKRVQAMEFTAFEFEGKTYTSARMRIYPATGVYSQSCDAVVFLEGRNTARLRERLRRGMARMVASEIRAGRLG